MDTYNADVRQIFIDIEDLKNTPQGTKVINALLASSAEMSRTKRGRLFLALKLDTFEKLRKQLRLQIDDGLDGLKLLSLAPKANPPA